MNSLKLHTTKKMRNDDDRSYQRTILTPSSDYASFVIIHLNDYTLNNQIELIIKQCMRVQELVLQIERDMNSSIDTSVAFSIELLNKVLQKQTGLLTYPNDLDGEFGSMPSTGGHIFLHVKSNRMDSCFEVSSHFLRLLKRVNIRVAHVDHTLAFLYKKNQYSNNGFGRDLSQFEDGTENPESIEEKKAALSSPNLINGACFAITQRWIHHRLEWFENELTEKEQENIIGRTKRDSLEYPDNEKSPNAHISRVVITDEEDNELEIVRQSMTYGDVTQHGLFFLAFSSDLNIIKRMLYRMVGKDTQIGEDAHFHDHLMKFTKAVRGQYWYVPSTLELQVGKFYYKENVEKAILQSKL
jgi:putative iron-dependent peroxidase